MGIGNRRAWAVGAVIVGIVVLGPLNPWRSEPSAVDRACDAVGNQAFEWSPFQYSGPISEQWPTVLPDDDFGLELGLGQTEWLVEPTRQLADAVTSPRVRADMLVLAKAYEDLAAGDSRDTVRSRYGTSTIKRAMHEASRFVRRACESAPLRFSDPCAPAQPYEQRWERSRRQRCADLWSSVSTYPPIVFGRCEDPEGNAIDCTVDESWDPWDDSDYEAFDDDPYGAWYDLQAYEYADRQSGP